MYTGSNQTTEVFAAARESRLPVANDDVARGEACDPRMIASQAETRGDHAPFQQLHQSAGEITVPPLRYTPNSGGSSPPAALTITNSRHHQNRLNGTSSVAPSIGLHRVDSKRGRENPPTSSTSADADDDDDYGAGPQQQDDDEADYYETLQNNGRLGTSNDIQPSRPDLEDSRRQAPNDNRTSASAISKRSGGNKDKGATTAGKNHHHLNAASKFTRVFNTRPDRIRWTKGKLVSKGTLGKVYLGTDSVSNDLLIAKEIKADAMPNLPLRLAQLKIDFRQLRVVNDYQHPNLIQYYGAEKVQDSIFIFSEFVPSLNLRDLMMAFGGSFSETIAATYLKPIVASVAFLHSAGVFAYDLKARNILVGVDGSVRLCDYGASFIFDETPLINEKSRWLAPEALRNEPLSGAIDSWSLGCTLLELLTGEDPFSNLGEILNVTAVIGNADSTEAPPFLPQNLTLTPTCLDFLRCCFKKSPCERWPTCALLAHPFLTTVKGYPKSKVMQENLRHNLQAIEELQLRVQNAGRLSNNNRTNNPNNISGGGGGGHHPGVFQFGHNNNNNNNNNTTNGHQGANSPAHSTSFSPPGSGAPPPVADSLSSLLGPHGGICTHDNCLCISKILLPMKSECTFNHLPPKVRDEHRFHVLQESLKETDTTIEELESFLDTMSPQNLLTHVIATLHSYENDRIINRGGTLGAPYVQWGGKNWQDDYQYQQNMPTAKESGVYSDRDDNAAATRYRTDDRGEDRDNEEEEEMVQIGHQPPNNSSDAHERSASVALREGSTRRDTKISADKSPNNKKPNASARQQIHRSPNGAGRGNGDDGNSDNENGGWGNGEDLFGQDEEEDDTDTTTTDGSRVLVVDIRTDEASTLVHFLPKADVGPLTSQQGTILVVVSFAFMVLSILAGGATVLAIGGG